MFVKRRIFIELSSEASQTQYGSCRSLVSAAELFSSARLLFVFRYALGGPIIHEPRALTFYMQRIWDEFECGVCGLGIMNCCELVEYLF